jgi:HEPN domain-containing protein
MDEAKTDLIQAWLRKAQHDLASARKLAAGPDPILDTATYHCQQAAEKAVKAFLAFRDHPLERTHNVRLLVTLAESYVPEFSAWREAAEQLTPYATAFRYPADFLEPGTDTFISAERAAAGLLAFVFSRLPAEIQQGLGSS